MGITRTPQGDTRTKTEEITVTLADGSTEKTVIETSTREGQAVLTALVDAQAFDVDRDVDPLKRGLDPIHLGGL